MTVLSPSPVFRWFVPAQSGTGLVPAAGYKAKWYSAGTTNAKAVYDGNGAIYPSPSNVVILNAEGYAPIRLGDGSYKIVVTDPNDNPVFSLDNIQGGSNFTSGFVDTVYYDLPGADTIQNSFTFCAGYYAVGDGGHGMFYQQTSSATPDGGYTIASTFDTGKRWFRIADESGDVRAASFGYIGTKSGNLSTELTNACSYCFGNEKRLIIGSGNVAKVGTSGQPFQLYTFNIHFEGTATLTADTGVTTLQIPVATVITGTSYPHFSGFTTISFGSEALIMPDPVWFGASTSSDNTTAFAKWIAASTGDSAFVLPPGVWPYTTPTTFPFPQKPMLLWGTIGSGGTAIPPGIYFPDGSRLRFGTWKLRDGQTITSSSSSYVEVSSGLRAGVDLIAGTTITAGTDITATGASFAGTGMTAGLNASAGGTYSFRAGKSTQFARAGGQLYVTLAPSPGTTSGTAETMMGSTVISATALNTNNDRITLKLQGSFVTTGSVSRRIRVSLNADANNAFNVVINPTTPGTETLTAWTAYVDIWRGSSSTAYCSGVLSTNYVSTDVSTPVGGASRVFLGSLDWTADMTLKVWGTASTSGSIGLDLIAIDLFPAP